MCIVRGYYKHFFQIDSFEKEYETITKIEPTQLFDDWFLVVVKPFKQALLNNAKRWSFMFKEVHLIKLR